MQNDINIFKKNINGRPLFQQNSYMPGTFPRFLLIQLLDIMNPHKSQKKHYDVHHNSEIARLAALDSMLQP